MKLSGFIWVFFTCTQIFAQMPVNKSATVNMDANTLAFLHSVQEGMGIEKAIQIESIEAGSFTNGRVALINYTTTNGSTNITIFQPIENGNYFSGQSIKCSGTNCDCYNRHTIAKDGSVNIRCSCTSCTMTITEFLTLNQFFETLPFQEPNVLPLNNTP
jgi:hypothetical protein